MPIRMEEDPDNGQRDQRRRNQNDQAAGGGGLGKLIPLALTFLLRKPKLLIPILLLGALWYFFLGGNQSLNDNQDISDSNTSVETIASDGFSFGATLSQDQYDKAQVFEPLDYTTSVLPRKVDLSQFAPSPQNQGRQGSCVGWASSYCAMTVLHSQSTGQKPDQIKFSPSYLYNQIALENCQGAYMINAMKELKSGGSLPYSEYLYDDSSCSALPSSREQARAKQFRSKGFNRLSVGAGNYNTDIQGIKQNLAQGAPVVIGMMVGGTFTSDMRGIESWQPTRRDYSQYGYSGHAMCLIGYDDNKNGGSFLIQNSWGPDWGRNGRAYVRYQDFDHFTKEAYGLYPMGNSQQFDPNVLAAKVALVSNTTGAAYSLEATRQNNVFRTVSSLVKGEQFKMAITNTVESYIYLFGEETDGSSYVLFPYTSKHSAYCGIIGTRVFPKDHSMVVDEVGQRDRIAVVLSKNELDYQQVNALFNQSNSATYSGKVQEVLSSISTRDIVYNQSEFIDFEAKLNGKDAVAFIIEIDK